MYRAINLSLHKQIINGFGIFTERILLVARQQGLIAKLTNDLRVEISVMTANGNGELLTSIGDSQDGTFIIIRNLSKTRTAQVVTKYQ